MFGNFIRMLCGVLVVFLFVELQLVRVVTRGHFLVYFFKLKKSLGDFCDFMVFLIKNSMRS